MKPPATHRQCCMCDWYLSIEIMIQLKPWGFWRCADYEQCDEQERTEYYGSYAT